MDGTILGQGTFTVVSGVPAVTVAIPSNADWMRVQNFTQFGTAVGASAAGVEFWWQRGMAAGAAIVKYKVNTVNSNVLQGDTITTGGFTLFDPSGNPLASSIAFTAITNATQPVVSTASTAGLISGTSIVRLSLLSGDTALANDVTGIDFLVDTVVANTSFRLANVLANAPGLTTGTGHWRLVNFDPLFYPRRRFVLNVTKAASGGVVTTNVPHGLTPGQAIRFSIPSISGMIELNSTNANNYQVAIVTAISSTDLCKFTINLDTSAFTTFTWPTVAQQPSSFPIFDPVGEDTATSLSSATIQVPGVASSTLGSQIFNTNTGILADSTVNTGFYGMTLGTGGSTTGGSVTVTGPAGTAASDVVFWVAGKSTFGGL